MLREDLKQGGRVETHPRSINTYETKLVNT